MIGTNKLILCPAEMCVAVQEYIDKRMGKYAPQVESVSYSNSSFEVLLRSRVTSEVADQ